MKIPIGNTNNISREGGRDGEGKQLDYGDWHERNACARTDHGRGRQASRQQGKLALWAVAAAAAAAVNLS